MARRYLDSIISINLCLDVFFNPKFTHPMLLGLFLLLVFTVHIIKNAIDVANGRENVWNAYSVGQRLERGSD